ncbi:MAG: ectonucleotide pyrophosphatase/phosphodiesterase [Blastocatellia bacterium]|nr:ectonucleotide pyrophosphatase/phosphodiesterase [Blastocatellia bacterium]
MFIVLVAFICPLLATAQPALIKDLKPTVILISIDGYRADYLEKYPSPTLGRLAKEGVRAKWMTPSFPSLTFPNHYAIATGLYPDHNGIVANNIYDPEFKQLFTMAKRAEVENGRWWLGEPIWVTAEKQGQRAAAYFFPGTEAEIGGRRPSHWKVFDDKVPNFDRVDTVLGWLDLPAAERPTMITMYFSDVDHAGHDAGPDSEAVREAILTVDRSLARLVEGVTARGIFGQVNLILVSDHGMARVDPRQVVVLDDHFDAALAETIVWSGTMVHIFPKPGKGDAIHAALKTKAPAHITVHRKQEMPARLHYGTSRRVGELVVVSDEGWTMSSRDRYRPVTVAEGAAVPIRGAHGFDPELASMRAFFVAHGAAVKSATVVEPFANVDAYNIMTRILGLKPAANDGGEAAAKAVLR